jgi:tRNA threonylcarbamoyl adenosine modification protein YeaZ
LNCVQVSLAESVSPTAQEIIFESTAQPEGVHRQEVAALILPEIDRALKESGWTKTALNLVVVGIGPGSFTGIRVAVITGRTLAQSLRLPLIGVSRLEASAAALAKPAAVILSAGNSNYFAGAYESGPADPSQALLAPFFAGLPALRDQIDSIENWWADEKSYTELAAIERSKPCQRLNVSDNLATAGAKLAISRLFLSGAYSGDRFSSDPLETFAWSKVFPLYLRSPSVTVKKSNGNTHKTADS